MFGYNTDRLPGLVFEAMYILVLKRRVHKQCHVNTFRIGTSTYMYVMESPSRAVPFTITEGSALKFISQLNAAQKRQNDKDRQSTSTVLRRIKLLINE